MKTMDAIKYALNMGDFMTMKEIEGLAEAPLTHPGPNGGCHPMWVMGHLAYVEGKMREILFGEANPLEKWGSMFDSGTEAVGDSDRYPAFAEVVSVYREHHERNLALLDSLTEADLNKPTVKPPKGAEALLATFGQAFLFLAMHTACHRGQLADARRVTGLQPVFG